MQPALFLDRDGVVNRETGYITHVDAFVFEPDFWTIAHAAHRADMPIVVITNQGGIGKGLMTANDLTLIHQRLLDGFAAQGLPAPYLYHCPHHPETGSCLCRKPHSLWFERALARHRLTPQGSWMIGDRERDLIPARKLGMGTIMIGEHDHPGRQSDHADYQFASIGACAAWVLTHGFATASLSVSHVRPT